MIAFPAAPIKFLPSSDHWSCTPLSADQTALIHCRDQGLNAVSMNGAGTIPVVTGHAGLHSRYWSYYNLGLSFRAWELYSFIEFNTRPPLIHGIKTSSHITLTCQSVEPEAEATRESCQVVFSAGLGVWLMDVAW